jgi:hypothetical protein
LLDVGADLGQLFEDLADVLNLAQLHHFVNEVVDQHFFEGGVLSLLPGRSGGAVPLPVLRARGLRGFEVFAHGGF